MLHVNNIFTQCCTWIIYWKQSTNLPRPGQKTFRVFLCEFLDYLPTVKEISASVQNPWIHGFWRTANILTPLKSRLQSVDLLDDSGARVRSMIFKTGISFAIRFLFLMAQRFSQLESHCEPNPWTKHLRRSPSPATGRESEWDWGKFAGNEHRLAPFTTRPRERSFGIRDPNGDSHARTHTHTQHTHTHCIHACVWHGWVVHLVQWRV